MIRFLLRMIGFLLLAAAFAAVIVDGTRSIAARHVMMFSLGDTAGWLFPARLADWGRYAEHGSPLLGSMLTRSLTLPTWLVSAGAALVCLGIGRRRRETIGYSGGR